MISLPPFRHLAPGTAAEAARMLADQGPGAVPVAGGTDLYPALKRRETTARVVVGLRGIPELHGIRTEEGGEVSVGAMTSLRDLAGPGVHPALARAAGLVASPQVRNVGTLGGNLLQGNRCTYFNVPPGVRRTVGPCLKAGGDTCWVAPSGDRCWAVVSSDLAPVAVALEADLHFTGAEGERAVPAGRLHTGDGLAPLARRPDEVLTRVVFPPPWSVRSAYWKLRRRGAVDFPVLSVAVSVDRARDGTCIHARIVLGAVAAAPVRAVEAEDALVGRRLGPEAVEEAARAAGERARPLDNTDLTSAYRKRSIHTGVVRALTELASPSSARSSPTGSG